MKNLILANLQYLSIENLTFQGQGSQEIHTNQFKSTKNAANASNKKDTQVIKKRNQNDKKYSQNDAQMTPKWL